MPIPDTKKGKRGNGNGNGHVVIKSLESLEPIVSEEAERSALGSCLVSERAAEDLAGILRPDDFYHPHHGMIFECIAQLVYELKPVDLLTLKEALMSRKTGRVIPRGEVEHESTWLDDVGGTDYIIQIAEYVPSASNARRYAEIVLEKAALRKLESAARDVIGYVRSDMAFADMMQSAESAIYAANPIRQVMSMKPVKKLAKDIFVEIDEMLESGECLKSSVNSGYYDLDAKVGGFFQSDVIIIAARPSLGKTSLALNIGMNVAKTGAPVVVFSLEMGESQISKRLMSMVAGVSIQDLRKQGLIHKDYDKLSDAAEFLSGLPMFVDCASDLSVIEMRTRCRDVVRDAGNLGCIVIDYLQYVRGIVRLDNKAQELAETMKALKAMAKEFNVPLFVLAQLNRGVEARENKRPVLSDIRDAGAIEAEADIVLMLYREAYYKPKEEGDQDAENVEPAEVIIAKHRNGPTGKVTLGFQPRYARFMNLKR